MSRNFPINFPQDFQIKWFLQIFIMLILISNIEGRTHKHDQSLFADIDPCAIKCVGGEGHPLCIPPSRSDKCGEDFFKYDVTSKNSPFQKDILLGHNGIRNRIAERMKVANMIKLKWDTDLEDMATHWVQVCKPYKKSPCASFYPNYWSDDSKDKYLYINTNYAYVKSNFLPPNLVVSVLRNWYLEKNTMEPPTIISYSSHNIKKCQHFHDTMVGYFKVHNNFTQIANSDTERIGCALARYLGGYNFVCFYHPYLKGDSFIEGPPVSHCPNLFPLPDMKYTNLCTADGTLSLHFQNINLINYLIICFLWLWL